MNENLMPCYYTPTLTNKNDQIKIHTNVCGFAIRYTECFIKFRSDMNKPKILSEMLPVSCYNRLKCFL